jgi:hypothetical protein
MADATRQTVLFPSLLHKPVHIAFDEPELTSDGGALLLKAVDDRLGLSAALADVIADSRDPTKVRHSLADLLRQRIFGLALGYPDANDVARIGADPMFRLLLDRDPVQGERLASQSTISRFENSATRRDLFQMGEIIAESVIDYHRGRLRRRRVRRITIDLDPTDSRTYGQQQLSFFNGHYGGHCYLPLLGFLTFNEEPEQYLYAAVLRSGRVSARHGAIGLLRNTIVRLREVFPKAEIRVRLDGGFAGPEMFEFLEQQRVEYLVAMGKNTVLKRRCARLMGTARRRSRELGTTVALFGETQYAARSWSKVKRRVIYKAEVTRYPDRDPRDNPRFVVTNLKLTPNNVYKVYRMRAESENRIKELLEPLAIDRMSCTSFKANQVRVLMTAAAYVILQTFRCRLSHTRIAHKQVDTLRLMLLKIAGKVRSSVRRITIGLAANHPWREHWQIAARAWGAVPT